MVGCGHRHKSRFNPHGALGFRVAAGSQRNDRARSTHFRHPEQQLARGGGKDGDARGELVHNMHILGFFDDGYLGYAAGTIDPMASETRLVNPRKIAFACMNFIVCPFRFVPNFSPKTLYSKAAHSCNQTTGRSCHRLIGPKGAHVKHTQVIRLCCRGGSPPPSRTISGDNGKLKLTGEIV